MRTVADFVAQTLRLAGAEVVFGYPGQSNLGLLHALGPAGIRYVQTADERAAGFAAMGYTLSTQKVGAVCVSKGPAATNLLTPLMSAMKDGVPLAVVTGNVARACRGRNGFQEFDVSSAFANAGAVKAARYCHASDDIPGALACMLEAAFTPPYGPALVDIPYDLLAHPCSADPVRVQTAGRVSAYDEPVDERLLRQAAAHLAAAERPLIIVGSGARRDYQLVRTFAAAYDCPVVHTMGGTGVIPTTHRLYGGLLRHNGSRTAARLVGRADLILVLGAGLDERATGEREGFARGAARIQVDVSANVLRRHQPLAVAIRGSIRAFLQGLDARALATSHAPWTADFLRAALVQSDAAPAREALTARDVIGAAHAALADAIVVKDSGSHKYWVTNLAPCADPSQSIASCHFGSMGFALPAAIGASIGNPGRAVIAACGDGGLLMALPDLLTAARECCENLKVLVFNNAGLGSTRDYERRAYSGRPSLSDFGERLSFARYAAAMGIENAVIGTRADLDRLSAALAARGLAVIDCAIDPTEPFAPSVPYLGPLARLADEDSAYVVT
jgi:acetolactate synthase-1/2/3 large subunit